jgi:hypothetical protein
MTIGIFDSGMGGLTVMRALKARLPGESFLYLGDTASRDGDALRRAGSARPAGA